MGKLGQALPPIESSAPIKELYIGAKQGSKMIAFIRGNLYSDKWGSFIREVVSNAYDANKISGYKGPVEIVLPSLIASELLIIDHGPGMSYEFMENDYTNVGFSTKEESEEEVGAFGIGRLTPLLVCDQYKIETVHKGLRHIWTMACGLRDGLVPEHQERTEKPSGTIIRVPCEVRDIPKIKEALQNWCSYLHPLPLVNNNPLEVNNIHISDPNSRYMEGDDWYVVKTSYTAITVLNGWVPYKVEHKDILNIWKDMGHLVIKCPIGKVSVTAPREALEYTEQTTNTIQQKVKDILSELLKRANEEIGCAINLRKALELNKGFPSPIKSKTVWKGYKLDAVNLKAEVYGAKKYQINKGGSLVERVVSYCDYMTYEKVFINDLPKFRPRLKQYMIDKGFNHRNDYEIYVIPLEQLNNPLVKEMQWPLLSSLPEIPKTPKVREADPSPGDIIKTNKKQIKAYIWRGPYSTRTAPNLLKYCDEVALPTDAEGGVCLVVRNGSITKGFNSPLPNSEVIRDLLKCLPDGTKLYLIPESSYPLMKGNWKLLDEIIREALGDRVNYFLELFCNRKYLPIIPVLRKRILESAQGINTLPSNELSKAGLDPGGVMAQYLKEGFEMAKGLEEYEAEVYAAAILTEGLPSSTKLTDLLNKVSKTYPLIKTMRGYGLTLDIGNTVKEIVTYVKAIDLYNKTTGGQ